MVAVEQLAIQLHIHINHLACLRTGERQLVESVEAPFSLLPGGIKLAHFEHGAFIHLEAALCQGLHQQFYLLAATGAQKAQVPHIDAADDGSAAAGG